MIRWTILALCVILGGCATTAPPEVQAALEHQLEDFALQEGELIPLIPDDAVVSYTALDGTAQTKPARELWSQRTRAFMVRLAGLVAWSRGEGFDPAAAFAKMFPERADDE